ncbi:DoxX family protein [Nocardiopsis listeri]|uniref:DoxX family protein n=1 Tax=Nocardiopsis listeri TaxID=53440 RepID=UPI000A59D4A2|nr:DoxX family protein [Nocardiopsis listeri]
MENVRNLALLASRVMVGILFIMHGWLKWSNLEATIAGFEALSVPFPTISAWFAMTVEMAGGVAFIVGIASPLVAVLFSVVSLGALFFAHAGGGFFAAEGGYELVLLLAVVSLGLGLNPGRFALDSLIFGRRSPSNRTKAEGVTTR